MSKILIVMGVSGCGKSTVGRLLAELTSLPFADGDDFHSAANKRKMSAGVPLTDEDRLPWLAAIKNSYKSLAPGIIACSALKMKYRQLLSAPAADGRQNHPVTFIYLKLSKEEAGHRLSARKGHFFDKTLLDSQFETLQEPLDGEDPHYRALTFDWENPPKTAKEMASLIASHISGLS